MRRWRQEGGLVAVSAQIRQQGRHKRKRLFDQSLLSSGGGDSASSSGRQWGAACATNAFACLPPLTKQPPQGLGLRWHGHSAVVQLGLAACERLVSSSEQKWKRSRHGRRQRSRRQPQQRRGGGHPKLTRHRVLQDSRQLNAPSPVGPPLVASASCRPSEGCPAQRQSSSRLPACRAASRMISRRVLIGSGTPPRVPGRQQRRWRLSVTHRDHPCACLALPRRQLVAVSISL